MCGGMVCRRWMNWNHMRLIVSRSSAILILPFLLLAGLVASTVIKSQLAYGSRTAQVAWSSPQPSGARNRPIVRPLWNGLLHGWKRPIMCQPRVLPHARHEPQRPSAAPRNGCERRQSNLAGLFAMSRSCPKDYPQGRDISRPYLYEAKRFAIYSTPI